MIKILLMRKVKKVIKLKKIIINNYIFLLSIYNIKKCIKIFYIYANKKAIITYFSLIILIIFIV